MIRRQRRIQVHRPQFDLIALRILDSSSASCRRLITGATQRRQHPITEQACLALFPLQLLRRGTHAVLNGFNPMSAAAGGYLYWNCLALLPAAGRRCVQASSRANGSRKEVAIRFPARELLSARFY